MIKNKIRTLFIFENLAIIQTYKICYILMLYPYFTEVVKEVTVALIKPDAVEAGKVDQILEDVSNISR